MAGAGDQGVAGDGGAQLAGSGGHGVGRASGVGPSVVGGPEAEFYVGDVINEGCVFGYFVGTDEVGFDVDELEHVFDAAVPLGLFVGDGEAYRTAAVPAG